MPISTKTMKALIETTTMRTTQMKTLQKKLKIQVATMQMKLKI
jgi:hypothetical protein